MIHCDWQRVDAARRGEDEGGVSCERVYGVYGLDVAEPTAGEAREVLDARNEASETSVPRDETVRPAVSTVEAEARDVRDRLEG